MTRLEPRSLTAEELVPGFTTDWTKADEPVVTGAGETHDQAGFPAVFRAGRYLDDALGEWHLYWSGHDGGGIRLHYADDLLGEWTPYEDNPVFDVADVGGGDHVASPSTVWDPVARCLNLYYHRGHPGTRSHPTFRQETELATSVDGTSFEKRTSVLRCPYDGSWDEQERSYLRVSRCGGAYVGVYQGRDAENNNPGIGYAWSRDGRTWGTLAQPLWANRHIEEYDPRAFQQGTPALVGFGGSVYVLLSYGGPSARAIYAVRFDHPRAVTGTPVPVLEPSTRWEGSILESPTVASHDGRAYLFYNGQDPSTFERAIGVATTELEGA